MNFGSLRVEYMYTFILMVSLNVLCFGADSEHNRPQIQRQTSLIKGPFLFSFMGAGVGYACAKGRALHFDKLFTKYQAHIISQRSAVQLSQNRVSSINSAKVSKILYEEAILFGKASRAKSAIPTGIAVGGSIGFGIGAIISKKSDEFSTKK